MDLSIEQIIDWLEQNKELHIKPKEWTDLSLYDFISKYPDDDWNTVRLHTILDGDFIKLNGYTKKNDITSNSHLEIAYIFRIDDFTATVPQKRALPQ